MATNSLLALRLHNSVRDNAVLYGVEVDSEGNFLIPNSMVKTIHTDVLGRIDWITVTDGTDTWRKAYTYPTGDTTVIGLWEKQA